MVSNWKSAIGVDPQCLSGSFLELWSGFCRTKLILCPSFLHSREVYSIVRGSSIAVGSQDVSQFLGGAYTGEIPAKYFSSIGLTHAIVGHAERRRYQKETNQIINSKFHQLVQEGIIPILCVGDDDPEASLQEVLRFLDIQLKESISQYEKSFFVAYEPSYAIGKSQISSDKIEKVCVHIKKCVHEWGGVPSVPVIYGGGVDSFVEFYSLWNRGAVDGVLLGRASFYPKKLVTMLKEAGFL